ncbi:MAG: GtrA family protein [Pseudomonadota bacterium]
MPHQNKILKYALAALAATIANIGTQWLVIDAFGAGAWMIYISVLIGTGVGLAAKFAMDKFLIFKDPAGGRKAVAQLSLYIATGVFTTIVFWGIELGFHFAYSSDIMRYAGGVIGLAVGYTLKYVIDTRYVFRHRQF